jgi:hypothetical protein
LYTTTPIRFYFNCIVYGFLPEYGYTAIATKFTVESNLILPTNYPIDFTFHHHNGKSKSQIDYILFKGKTFFLYSSELHLSHAGLVYILADFGANLLIWVVISTLIRVWKQKNTIKLSVADRIATLENTLRKAGRKSIPKYRRLKTLKSVGRGIWNRNIDRLSFFEAYACRCT